MDLDFDRGYLATDHYQLIEVFPQLYEQGRGLRITVHDTRHQITEQILLDEAAGLGGPGGCLRPLPHRAATGPDLAADHHTDFPDTEEGLMGEAKRRRELGLPPRRGLREELQQLLIKGEAGAAKEILSERGLTPEGVREVMKNALGWGAAMAEDLRDSSPVACRAGCDWCCYLPVDVTVPEVLVLAAHLEQTFSAEALAAVRARVQQAADRIAGQPDRARFGMKLACPLLVDHRCSVYAVRPAACIANNAKDASGCERVYRGQDAPDELLDANGGMFDAGYIPAQIAHMVLTANGAPPLESLELIEALRVALATPNAARRWLDGEPLFDSARRSEEYRREIESYWAAAEAVSRDRQKAKPEP